MLASSIIRTAAVAAQPWRNGGGVTRTLLTRPRGENWQVRVSVADVAVNGPFSRFPGVERWFAVLEGAGVVLTIAGKEHALGATDAALSFRGDAAARCRLVDGPTRDLNLMLSGVRGKLVRIVPGVTWRPRDRECGLYATTAGRCRASARGVERGAEPRGAGPNGAEPNAAGPSAAGSARAPTAADALEAAEPIPAQSLRWWPIAPRALDFDGAGWWLSADVTAP